MTFRLKLLLTSLLGASALVALFLFKSFSQDYFSHRNTIELAFKEIETAHKRLDYQILNNAFFLYTNQDDVNQKIDTVDREIEAILHNPHVISSHPAAYSSLRSHSAAFEDKIRAIYDFQTVNTVIKNSISAILVMQQRLFAQDAASAEEQELFREINRISSTILMAKNGMDGHLLSSLRPDIDALSYRQFTDSSKNEMLQRIIAHFGVIERSFSRYVSHFEEINDREAMRTLEKSRQLFLEESDREWRLITYFSYLLVALFIISIGLITLFLVRSEKEARRDSLTGLGNRKAYEEKIRFTSKKLALILININKFKHYNDFYGVESGDHLLVATADRIRTMGFGGSGASYYRLGADDFGIVFEESRDIPLETVAKEVLELFGKRPIVIDQEERTPSITVAASNTAPLLENADMALKSNAQTNPIIYHEGLNLRQIVAENVMNAQELKKALEQGRIFPYFQPIVNLEAQTISKHEVLGRIVTEKGEVQSIFPYLHVAKESKLYHSLSRTIISKSFEIITEYHGDFSINLAIEDIGNEETVRLILRFLEENQEIGKRLIFEILENEAIEEYEGIARFISLVRRYGCRIAIDDFGSGYSNFARILNLAVDIIKIDGSLIRHLDSDDKAVTIVQTIVNFTKHTSIETVAEFVHNQAVADIVCELGINSAQGFFFYEPAPLPLTRG